MKSLAPLKKQSRRSFMVSVPNSEYGKRLTRRCLYEAYNSDEFLKKYHIDYAPKQPLVKVRVPHRESILRRNPSVHDLHNEMLKIAMNLPVQQIDDFVKIYKSKVLEKKAAIVQFDLIDENGNHVTDKHEIEKLLIEKFKRIQTAEDEPFYTSPIKFPTLEKLSSKKFHHLLQAIARDKTVSYDLFSDIIFEANHINKTREVFKDIWSNLNKLDISKHFEQRLIPVNKDHPQIANINRVRPIAVTSPFVKLLEVRFLGKLNEYLKGRMFPGQIGFVPDCGVTINLVRAINIIQEQTSNGDHVFGIFIDFPNAFNTLKHSLLFERLKGILEPDEIEFIRAMFSRNSIRLGKHSFKPNIGVSQGSLLSPALFDIYIEDLFKELVQKGLCSVDNIIAYADDVLILVKEPDIIKDILSHIGAWGERNGLAISPEKSAILEFSPRRTRKKIIKENKICGVPVLRDYKYLGFWLNDKLKLEGHMLYVLQESAALQFKLAPILSTFSVKGRIHYWKTYVEPYLKLAFPAFQAERSYTRRLKFKRLLQGTFKKWTKIPRNTSKEDFIRLCGYDIDQHVNESVKLEEEKWLKRRENWPTHE